MDDKAYGDRYGGDFGGDLFMRKYGLCSSQCSAEGWLYGVGLYGAVWCIHTTVVWVYGIHTLCDHVCSLYGCPYSITAAHDGAMV